MNRIVYTSTYHSQTFTFENTDLINGTMKDTLNEALISETLSIDTGSFTIRGRDASDPDYLYPNTDFSKYTYGDEIDYYIDNTLYGKYYLYDVAVAGDGSGEITFYVESLMGILEGTDHAGGVYSGTNAGTIIAEILGTYPYSIDGDLSATMLFGWLPYDSSLANLTQVLFACGASVLKDANGDLYFTYNLPTTASVFDTDHVYMGGARKDITPATIVKVTEHTYLAAAIQSETLFDNTGGATAVNYEIRFDQPYHSLTWTGSTITSGANYAILNGNGVLTGIPYVHIQRIKNKSTGVAGKVNEKTANDCTLISSLNSDQVLDRLAAYYAQTQEVSAAILAGTEMTGSLIQIPDPADLSQNILGYIKGMKRTYSSKLKADVALTSDWHPSNVGNAYDSYLVVRASDLVGGNWNVPSAMQGKRALIILFGGSQGGQGGWYGESPDEYHGDPSFAPYIQMRDNTRYYIGLPVSPHEGGDGGEGGHGGYAGKMLMFNIASLEASYPVSLGTGGTGGTGGTVVRDKNFDLVLTDPTEGAYGTHSVFGGTYDTDNGNYPQAAIVNIVTGNVLVPQRGTSGTAGAKGGKGGSSRTSVRDYNATYDYSAEGRGEDGDGVSTYSGGNGADGTVGYELEAYGSTSSLRIYHHIMLAGGGGGGGAAMGGNGANGTVQQWFRRSTYGDSNYRGYTGRYWNWDEDDNRSDYLESANGGDGGDVSITPSASDLVGGSGGHGGGGGGAGAAPLGWDNPTTWVNSFSYGWAAGGLGGNGGDGGQGSDGWFVVYYKA